LVLDKKGSLYGWGSNEKGQFSMYSDLWLDVPQTLQISEKFKLIKSSWDINYAISRNY